MPTVHVHIGNSQSSSASIFHSYYIVLLGVTSNSSVTWIHYSTVSYRSKRTRQVKIHTTHERKGGQNFSIDESKNEWNCFETRHERLVHVRIVDKRHDTTRHDTTRHE